VRHLELLELAYFNSKPIDEITNKDTFEIFECIKTQPVKSKSITADTDTLTSNTLRSYRSVMNHIFNFAKTKGYIDSISEMPIPSVKPNPRPHFSKHDWKMFTVHMRK
jgi:hypothetical protein